MKTDVIEFQTFKSNGDMIHKFVPFQQDIKEITLKEGISSDELDTIVVPANEDGFIEEFLGEERWYAVRISSAMIDRIKYIAAYQTAPVSAITYYAEVANIEKYKDTGKYIVRFKSKAKPIGPIHLSEKKQGAAPQSLRYTTFSRLLRAKTLADLF
jgi:predicted DNA binding CopG/RHH family protein